MMERIPRNGETADLSPCLLSWCVCLLLFRLDVSPLRSSSSSSSPPPPSPSPLVNPTTPFLPHHSQSKSPAARLFQQAPAQLRTLPPSDPRLVLRVHIRQIRQPTPLRLPGKHQIPQMLQLRQIGRRRALPPRPLALLPPRQQIPRRVPLRQRLDAATRRPGLRAGAAAAAAERRRAR